MLRKRKSTEADGDITCRVNWGDAIPSDMSFPEYLKLTSQGKFKLKFVKKFRFEELLKLAVSKSLSLHTQYLGEQMGHDLASTERELRDRIWNIFRTIRNQEMT